MDNVQCSLLFVHPHVPEAKFAMGESSKVRRYFDSSPLQDSSHNDLRDSILHFLNVFLEVVTVPSTALALRKLKYRSRVHSPPTILLIDIDADPTCQTFLISDHHSVSRCNNDFLQVPDDSRTRSILLPLELIQIVADELNSGTLDKVVPLVCSYCDDPGLMLESLDKGAEDFILKPIDLNKAKTMFLNLRRQIKRRAFVVIPPAPLVEMQSHLDKLNEKPFLQSTSPLKDRLHEVFVQDKLLSDFMIDFYTPAQPMLSMTSPPGLDSASSQERIQFLKSKLSSWDFSPHDYSQEDSLRCVCLIFDNFLESQTLDGFRLTREQLHAFLLSIRQSYHSTNPYHNFTHALDVLQAVHIFLCCMGVVRPFTKNGKAGKLAPLHPLGRLFRPLDILALLIAAIGHDVGHPGVNNLFMINTCTPLAQVYNDRSVLESFHCMALFQLMKKHGFEDSQKFPILQPENMDFRKVIISTILATDMSLHFDFMERLKSRKPRLVGEDYEGEPTAKQLMEDRTLLCSTIIKCADISNAARPFYIAEEWANVLLKEWANQGILEKELGIPVSPGNDPETTSKPVSQITFIEAFVQPLFEYVSQMIPSLNFTLGHVRHNRGIWEQRLNIEKPISEPNTNGETLQTGLTREENGINDTGIDSESISERRLSQLGQSRRFSVPFISTDGSASGPIVVSIQMQGTRNRAADVRACRSLSSSPKVVSPIDDRRFHW